MIIQVSVGNSDYPTLCATQSSDHKSASARGLSLERAASYGTAKAMISSCVINEEAAFPTDIPSEPSKYAPTTGQLAYTERHPHVIAVGCSVPCRCCKVGFFDALSLEPADWTRAKVKSTTKSAQGSKRTGFDAQMVRKGTVRYGQSIV